MCPRRIALALVALSIARPLLAQCPDGTPPPCPSDRAPRRTVAVLPFENRSRDTADAYLPDGLAEEITARLGRSRRLAVTSQAAVRRVGNAASLDMARLGRVLNAAYLVSGTVQRTGRRLVVAVELVRAATGERLWSDRYDRTASDLLAVATAISVGAATAVLGRLPPGERARLAAPPTSNSDAYDLYLRGSRRLFEADPTALQDAIASFEAALQLDPAFAAAHGRLAAAYSRALTWDVPLPGMSADAVAARGWAEANRALAQDSTSADAWGGRGVMLFYRDEPDYAGSLAALRRATLLDSTSAVLHALYGNVVRRFGDFETAEVQSRRALALQPDLTQAILDLAFMAFTRRRLREAAALLDSSLAINPHQWQHYGTRLAVHLAMGDTAVARRDGEAMARVRPAAMGGTSTASLVLRAAVGDTSGARAQLDSILAAFPREGPLGVRRHFGIAQALIMTGQIERGLDVLERIRPRGAWLWSYLVTPYFDAVRSKPRFQLLVEEARPPGAPRMP